MERVTVVLECKDVKVVDRTLKEFFDNSGVTVISIEHLDEDVFLSECINIDNEL